MSIDRARLRAALKAAGCSPSLLYLTPRDMGKLMEVIDQRNLLRAMHAEIMAEISSCAAINRSINHSNFTVVHTPPIKERRYI